jgi:hypothetical protein
MKKFILILDGNFETIGVKINTQTISLLSLIDLYNLQQNKDNLQINKIVNRTSVYKRFNDGSYSIEVTFGDGHKENYTFHSPDNMFFVEGSFGTKVQNYIVKQLKGLDLY